MTVPSNENFSAQQPQPGMVPRVESHQVATWEDVKQEIPEFLAVAGMTIAAAGVVASIVIESQIDDSPEQSTGTAATHEGQPMLFGHDQEALHNAHNAALWGGVGGGALLGLIGLAGMAAKADRKIRSRLNS